MWDFTYSKKMAERSSLKTVQVHSFWKRVLSLDPLWTGKPVGPVIRSAGKSVMNSLTKLNTLWKWPLGLLKNLWTYQQQQSLKKPHNRSGAKSSTEQQYGNWDELVKSTAKFHNDLHDLKRFSEPMKKRKPVSGRSKTTKKRGSS